MRNAFALALCLAAALLSAPGCTKEGCLDGAEGCVVPSPCQALQAPTCEDTSLVLKVIQPGDEVPGGLESLGAVGDVLIGNSRVTAVIDAIDNVNFLGMSGGFLLDISTNGAEGSDDNDSLNQILHAAGLLPEDTVVYKSLELIEGDGYVAVQVKGHLAGDVRHRVASRYEVRPCEPGIRVRTEMVNAADDDAIWGNVDGFWWGGRQNWAFTPLPGIGFLHPPFGLTTVNEAFREFPFLVASAWSEPVAAYATVSCTDPLLYGFQAEQVSGAGGPRSIVRPGDYSVYERVHLAADGRGVQPAADLALEVRERLYGEAHARVRGRVTVDGQAGGVQRDRAIVMISEGSLTDPVELRTPLTVVLPDEDGAFEARVPAGRRLIAEVVAFGRVVASEQSSPFEGPDWEVGDIDIPSAGLLTASVTLDGVLDDALVFVLPADDETEEETRARFLGIAPNDCAPLIAYPYGPSPACNRFLTKLPVAVEVPPGTYDVFATAGPFATLGHRRVVVEAGTSETLTFALRSLEVTPTGTLSADFHVHGSKSFDTMFPDVTRVQSFLASGLDVIAATEHDAIHDYANALAELEVTDEIVLLVGLETTGFVLWHLNPDVTYPQVIGHWNFWPVRYRPERPRNGAPSDEMVEPGQLFMRVKQAELPDWGVIQMNHPISEVLVGRDFGWVSALNLDLNEPLPVYDDGSASALFFRQPDGAGFRNSDYHTQEVMNGSSNGRFLQYRAFWFYLLNQGYLRAGTANSDSHSLTDEIVGTPRTLVWSGATRQDFDARAFNVAVREGRMIGTNGPVLDVSVVGEGVPARGPSLAPFAPPPGAGLRIQLTAAPWVYVDEIRVIVNGEVAHVIDSGIANAANPFGEGPLVRYDATIPLRGLVPGGERDAWIVVEAGAPLPLHADLSCDGVPDTTDNNGDSVVDWRDVDRNDDGRVTGADLEDEAPAACEGGAGPLLIPAPPPRDSDAYPFWAVSDRGYPLAFTNPLVLDIDGDGFTPPGL